MSDKKITIQRQLRQSQSYWETTSRIKIRTKLRPSARSYDVIVVGAGISGAMVSEALLRTNNQLRIAIIDRRAPISGSSMASTAMIQHELDVPLFKLSRLIEQKDAETIWLRSAKAVEDIVSLAKELDIQCHMQPKKALYLAGDSYGHRALQAEVECRKSIGLECTFLDAAHLKEHFQIDRTAGIASPVSASANPAQLTAGLLRVCAQNGAEIIQNTEITDFVSLNGKVALATEHGSVLTASHVIFCTGYEFLKTLSHKDHQIISTWAIASKENIQTPPWLKDYLVWEASDPYLYLRLAEDGRLIAGGEDENSEKAYLDSHKGENKKNVLSKKISSLIGTSINEPEYSWSAAFGSTRLGIPMIGEVPGYPQVFAAMGYGGNGITFSKIAAEILSAFISGKTDKDLELFKFR